MITTKIWKIVSEQKVITGICTVIAGLGVMYGFRKVSKIRKRRQQRIQWDNAGEDVVVLHQFWRGKYCINLSPFAVKLETFLRLANIKYVVDTDAPFGPKKKCPWITLNGEDTGDSEMIIQKLIEEFKVDLDSHLDAREKGQMEAIRITADEFVFWFVIAWRYWIDKCETFLKSQSFTPFLNWTFPIFMTKGAQRKSYNHGIGTHSPEEIYGIAKRTCGALSDILGEDPFYGGERPCTADCAVFGQLSQLMWNAPGSKYEALVREMYPSLGNYCNRMKDTVFPDWNKLLKPPQE